MEFEFVHLGKTYKIAVDFKDGCYLVNVENEKFEVDVQLLSANCLSLLVNNKIHTIYIAENKERKYLAVGGEQFCLAEAKAVSEKEFVAEAGPIEGKQFVCSPMPGTVIKINVAEGEEVEKNQSLVIVEAMKMENEIRSPIKGKVKKINCTAGDLVGADEPIIELETEEAN